MSAETNKRVMQQFFDAVNAHDPDRLVDLMAEDLVEHEEFPGLEPNRDGVRQFFTSMIAAFPDLRFEPQQMVAEGDTVVTLVSMTGTHEGEFAGIPASGRPMSVPTVDIVRFDEEGKAAEHWSVTDSGAMMQQLGVVPEAAA